MSSQDPSPRQLGGWRDQQRYGWSPLLVLGMVLATVTGVVAGALLGGTTGIIVASMALLASVWVFLVIGWPPLMVVVLLLMTPWLLVEAGAGVQAIHLAAVLVIGAFLVCVMNGSLHVPVRPTIVAAGAVVLVFLVASILSADLVPSLRVTANHALGFGLACSVAALGTARRAYLHWVLRAWLVGSLWIALTALTALGSLNVRFGGALVEGRVSGTFAQPNELGEYGLLTLVVATLLFTIRPHRYDRWLAAVAGVLALAIIVISLSRGTWIGLAAFGVALVILRPRTAKVVVLIPVAGAAALGVAALAGNTLAGGLLSRLGSIGGGGDNPSDAREVIYRQALRFWQENQWLGLGPGGFGRSSRTGVSELLPNGAFHAHNVVLQFGAELGVIGVLGLVVVTLTASIAAFQILAGIRDGRYPRAGVAVIVAGFVGLVAHGMLDYVYTNPLLVALLWILVGVFVVLTTPVDGPFDTRLMLFSGRERNPTHDDSATHPAPAGVGGDAEGGAGGS